METINLHFHGPLTFTPGERCLCYSSFHAAACVYLWTFQSDRDGLYYIHYVGETTSFAARHREHLIHILGMNYGIFDPDEARQGIQKRVWPGLWRDRSQDATARVLEKYAQSTADVLRYIEALAVFVAETNVDKGLRKHIEGSIGWNLRNNHKDEKVLYPDDNHIGTSRSVDISLRVSTEVPIAGIDAILVI